MVRHCGYGLVSRQAVVEKWQQAEVDMASRNTTLIAINRGGIATLADGSCWHIASSELSEVTSWGIGTEVVVEDQKLINAATGVQVPVVPIPLSAGAFTS